MARERYANFFVIFAFIGVFFSTIFSQTNYRFFQCGRAQVPSELPQQNIITSKILCGKVNICPVMMKKCAEYSNIGRVSV